MKNNLNTLALLREQTIFPPGSTIVEELPYRDKTPEDLAQHLGKPIEYVQQLIDGQIPVDEALAEKLHEVFRLSVTYWLNKERRYRRHLAEYEAKLQDEADREMLKDFFPA